jgi:hypothetical protein
MKTEQLDQALATIRREIARYDAGEETDFHQIIEAARAIDSHMTEGGAPPTAWLVLDDVAAD